MNGYKNTGVEIKDMVENFPKASKYTSQLIYKAKGAITALCEAISNVTNAYNLILDTISRIT